ncbi:hypothetical protein ACHHYP_20834 [Achlya hypogyna]|uniref:AMP-dependent synthetase/ligase domain-containing protein n=1 Tax=Achlya hypogyna TaxID=1202772 RepID=A0A1V9Y5Q9_ACHHY|nr:hypothetical protein ACHHYP_20834 [Achlya hypogyna]
MAPADPFVSCTTPSRRTCADHEAHGNDRILAAGNVRKLVAGDKVAAGCLDDVNSFGHNRRAAGSGNFSSYVTVGICGIGAYRAGKDPVSSSITLHTGEPVGVQRKYYIALCARACDNAHSIRIAQVFTSIPLPFANEDLPFTAPASRCSAMLTWRAYFEQSSAFEKSLVALCVQPFNAASIIGFNTPEWLIANVGCILPGGITASIYTTNNPPACQYIAAHARCY